MGLKTQLLKRLKHEDSWTSSGDIERWEFRHKNGTLYKPATINRELRRLQEEMPHRIEKKYEGRANCVAYKYLKSKFEQFHEQRK